jgi:ribonuclease HI
MELLAVIKGLEALKAEGIPVTIYSDSKYVVDAVEKGWIWNWQKKGFKDKKNVDLWKRYIPLHLKYKPTFRWVKGHAGNKENERCDQLAVAAAENPSLPADTGYEQAQAKSGLF